MSVKDKSQEKFQVQIITRLDIDSSQINRDKIINLLRKQRRKVPIISINCHDAEIASWAAQDNRVDILTFPINKIGKLFSRSIAKLMIKFPKFLEISLSNLYIISERHQIPAFRQVKQALKLAQQKNVPVIINSGSKNVDELRHPLELVSLAYQFFKDPPVDSISTIPNKFVKENLLKISTDYISPGIYRVSSHYENNSEEEE
jgi:RNase P/RNase MRP subunit p30